MSRAGDAGDPDGRAQEVEESKCSPAHAQHASQRSGENAEAEDEAGKENGGCAVAGEHVLAAFQRGRRNPKEALIAIEQRTPAVVDNGIANVVAERGGTGGDHEESSEIEPVVGITQKACQQKR